MKTVRLENNIIVEIIPDYALPVAHWYGVEFASKCVEAPDEVECGMVYNGETFVYQEPTEPEPTAQDDTDALVVDHEYRITMLELGLTEEGGVE